MAIKIFYFFIFYFILSVVIYGVSGFTLNIYFLNITFFIASIVTIVFSYYLFKAIKNGKVNYKLKSIESYVGFIGVNLIILFFIVGVVIYPTAYLIHKMIENEYQETFVILSKSLPYRSFISCTYEIKLKNEEAIIRKCLPNQDIYNRVILNSTVKAKAHKSFFGLTIDSFELELKN